MKCRVNAKVVTDSWVLTDANCVTAPHFVMPFIHGVPYHCSTFMCGWLFIVLVKNTGLFQFKTVSSGSPRARQYQVEIRCRFIGGNTGEEPSDPHSLVVCIGKAKEGTLGRKNLRTAVQF